jgi:glycosyltransferase involved in cell wall biosynthesis
MSLAPGGLERLVVDWTNVRNQRHPGSTAICCLDEPGELAAAVQGAEVVCLRACRSRFPFVWSAVRRLRKVVRGSGFAAVHSHNLAALQYSALAIAGLQIRHVHTEHGSNPHAAGPFGRMRGRWLYGKADAVVAVSEATRHALESAFGLKSGSVRVIRNGVLVSDGAPGIEGRAEQRRKLNIPPGSCVIGSVGRLAEVKGYDRLLRAFAEMAGGAEGGGRRAEATSTPPHSDTPRLILLLIGDGPERAALEALALTLGISDRVKFAGFRADARRLLVAMDLFVLPSRSEGLSVSLLEAMAEGVPVAVTDVGANLEVIESGNAGIVLPADEAEWPAILAHAVRHAEPVKVSCAAERVRGRYAIDQTVDAYETLYGAE